MQLFAVIALAVFFVAAYIIASVGRLKENSATVEQVSRELLVRLQSIEGRLEDTERDIKTEFVSMRKEQGDEARAGREEQLKGLISFGDAQSKRIKEVGDLQRESLESFSQQLTNISRLNEEKLEALRGTVEAKLQEIHKGNEEKLEKMRATVDEQLHSTLEKRLGEAFSTVSERLELVHKGLGEMKALTADVGDLKRVLSNVKVRGTWGETQLRALLEQILTKDQYAENVATKPNCGERVEFAISLPGAQDSSSPVWLPIDSKFPLEDYQRLVTASEVGDTQALADAQKALKNRVIDEARTIRDKYLEPPYTTDFGILYLPIEGLYSEILRIDGLCELLSREYRVVPAGPTTIAALLNSLQMGFRTLAIEKRSSEVWILLGKVKTEFDKFGSVLEKTRQKIEQAGKELENAEVRTRAIKRTLKTVEGIPLSSGEEDDSDNCESLE